MEECSYLRVTILLEDLHIKVLDNLFNIIIIKDCSLLQASLIDFVEILHSPQIASFILNEAIIDTVGIDIVQCQWFDFLLRHAKVWLKPLLNYHDISFLARYLVRNDMIPLLSLEIVNRDHLSMTYDQCSICHDVVAEVSQVVSYVLYHCLWRRSLLSFSSLQRVVELAVRHV
jgi:hypothetical protein